MRPSWPKLAGLVQKSGHFWAFFLLFYLFNPLYTDTRYNDAFHYNDNLTDS